MDVFLSKYDSEGSKVWTQLLGSSVDEYGKSVGTAADGSVYIVGNTSGDLDGHTNSGDRDVFLSKYNSDGSKAWTELLGSPGDESAYSVSTHADSVVYVGGSTNDNLGEQINNGGVDAFLSKYTINHESVSIKAICIHL